MNLEKVKVSPNSQDVVLRSWNDTLTAEVHVETNIYIFQFLIYYRRVTIGAPG